MNPGSTKTDLLTWGQTRLADVLFHLDRYGGRVRSLLFGTRSSYGLVFTILAYALLVTIGFVYLYPLLFMLITSLKSPTDLLNPMVQWIPSELYFGNYAKAFRVLNYPSTLLSSTLVSVVPSLIQLSLIHI